jgi:hypothetical protein
MTSCTWLQSATLEEERSCCIITKTGRQIQAISKLHGKLIRTCSSARKYSVVSRPFSVDNEALCSVCTSLLFVLNHLAGHSAVQTIGGRVQPVSARTMAVVPCWIPTTVFVLVLLFLWCGVPSWCHGCNGEGEDVGLNWKHSIALALGIDCILFLIPICWRWNKGRECRALQDRYRMIRVDWQ